MSAFGLAPPPPLSANVSIGLDPLPPSHADVIYDSSLIVNNQIQKDFFENLIFSKIILPNFNNGLNSDRKYQFSR